MSGSNSSLPSAVPEPVDPVGLTVHSQPDPGQVLARQRTAAGRRQMLLVLLICALPVLVSYYLYYVVRPAGSTAYGTLIQPTRAMPAVQALDLDGRPQPLRGLAGQWLLVMIDDAACTEACERRLFLQRQLREMMGRDRDRVDKVWLLSDDAPLRPALRQALEATPAMHLLRLPRATVAAWLQPAAGRALQDHLYIVDPQGEWMMRAPADADPGKLKRDLERLLRASAGWDRAGR